MPGLRGNDSVDHEAGRPSKLAISRARFDAAIFDLDGVLTDTARIHAQAWKAVFDPLLKAHAGASGSEFKPFDLVHDYRAYVDGRTRLDGIRSFLGSRSIVLPEAKGNSPNEESVEALGARKAELFLRRLDEGIEPMPGAMALLQKLRTANIKIAVVSASKNCAAVLRAARFDHLIDVRVDGVEAERHGLRGKPDPSLFLEAAKRMAVRPSRTIMFEDALAGVQAGKSGGFGCVVGVGRASQAEALRAAGAERVVSDLTEIDVEG